MNLKRVEMNICLSQYSTLTT